MDFKELSIQELNIKKKKIRNNKIMDAIFVGFVLGISIYNTVSTGFDFFTLFPLILAFQIIRNSKNNKIIEKELQSEIDARE